MKNTAYRLENSWRAPDSVFEFVLVNLSDETISDFTLVYTSLTRVVDTAQCENAVFVARNANYHEFAPPEGLSLAPGEQWSFSVGGLWRAPLHRTDGAKSAYINFGNGHYADVAVGDLLLKGATAEHPPQLMPPGKLDEPYALLPWPAELELTPSGTTPIALFPKDDTHHDDLKAIDTVSQLFTRLFPAANSPFCLTKAQGGIEMEFVEDPDLEREAYCLTFSDNQVIIHSSAPAGRQYGLTALAQMLSGARSKETDFRFPASGRIKDHPRYDWRGTHLDVSRRFYRKDDIVRLMDILAWSRMNIFHWHLTDDEAWRLEINAYPELTTIGATRAPGTDMLPQLGNGAEAVSGFYTQNDVREVVAHGVGLNIEIIPEIDIPGHSTAILAAIPELADGQEAPESYHSVQGFPNNALNPAIEATYTFLDTVFDEMVDLFPSRYLHVGGDEVANNTWLQSPQAKALMTQQGINGTFGLQSYFMKRVQTMLTARGKTLAGWNEVSHGGGVDREGTLLMAWQSPAVGIALAEDGYDVVMTPGQAYYLDMVQDEAFQEPGASWAGTVPPQHTYEYEAQGDFPEGLQVKLKGVQACIWCEHFLSRDYFNHLVFPRLYAVAEAAWTPTKRKDWLRFAAVVPSGPKL